MVFDPMAYLYEDRTFRSNVLKKVILSEGPLHCNRQVYRRIVSFLSYQPPYYLGSYSIHVASSPHSLLPENRDILGLTIPEAAPAKILCGHVTAIVRHCLCWLGMPVARYVYQFVHPECGRVKPIVKTGNIFPLQEMAAAQVKQREGHVRGKIVVEITKQM